MTAPPPLTAEFLGAPASHDGQTAFTLELRFSEGFPISYATLRDHAFTVTGGEVTGVRRLEPPGNVRWEITVTPDTEAAVTVELAPSRRTATTRGPSAPVTAECCPTGQPWPSLGR